MKQKSNEKPIQLQIDVKQWRSDIQTFADSTKQALDSIVAQLANSCSNSFDSQLMSPHRNELERFADSATFAENEPGSDDRLAKLKSRLAQRISKTDQVDH